MAEWLVERGIGEVRAALVADGGIRAIRIEAADTPLRLGEVVAVRVTKRRWLPDLDQAECADGATLLLRGSTAPEGARLHAAVVREAGLERGRHKRAVAVPHDGPAAPAPSLEQRLETTGVPIRLLHPYGSDELEEAGWSERLEEATTGELVRPGCTLRLFLTPAMTLIDVDGSEPVDALALAGAREAAAAIELFDLGGSIGIDLPTVGARAARLAVGQALDAALPAPFERTAMNGFGFVQVVRPRPRASLPETIAADRIGHRLRAVFRQAECEPPGRPLRLTLSDRLVHRLEWKRDWLAELERRRGAAVTVAREASWTALGARIACG